MVCQLLNMIYSPFRKWFAFIACPWQYYLMPRGGVTIDSLKEQFVRCWVLFLGHEILMHWVGRLGGHQLKAVDKYLTTQETHCVGI